MVNPAKTKFISFCTAQSKKYDCNHPTIFLGECPLKAVQNTKFLGLTIDECLNWTNHVTALCNKVSSGIYALRRMAKICDLDTLKTIYFAFIHSHISFGLILYGATSNENLNKILMLQKQAIRIILNLNWNESVKHRFSQLGILTVYGQYIFELIMFIRKNLASLSKLGENHSYQTRNKNKIANVPHKLKFLEKKPSYAGIKYYNSIPNTIKDITDITIFKRKLRKYLIDRPFYSLNEFFEHM